MCKILTLKKTPHPQLFFNNFSIYVRRAAPKQANIVA